MFISLQNELFINLQNKEEINDNYIDQNRLYSGFGYRFIDKLAVQGGYMYRYLLEDAKMYNHILQVTVNTSFKCYKLCRRIDSLNLTRSLHIMPG